MSALRSIEAPAGEQGAAIAAALQARIDQALSTDPVDREVAVDVVAEVYRDLLGRREPDILWVGSPVEAIVAASQEKNLGLPQSAILRNWHSRNATITAFDGTALSAIPYAATGFTPVAWGHLVRSVPGLGAADVARLGTYGGLLMQLDRVLTEQTEAWLDVLEGGPRLGTGTFVDGGWRPVLPALIDIAVAMGRADRVANLKPLADLGQVAGHVLAFPEVCWMCERPTALRFNAEHRLHAEDGAALAWQDEAHAVYAWRGQVVPFEVILAPLDLFTPQAIEFQPHVGIRDVMIERYGVARYVRESRARVVHRDETGRLWVKRHNLTNDRWCVVEVTNGTPEPDGSFSRFFLRVPPATRTAKEGVAWTYGLSADEYDDVQRT